MKVSCRICYGAGHAVEVVCCGSPQPTGECCELPTYEPKPCFTCDGTGQVEAELDRHSPEFLRQT